MAITITLPDNLHTHLEHRAQAQHRSVEEVTVSILQDALEQNTAFPTTDSVVARIKATRPNPQNVRPASGSLADLLRNTTSNAQFDLERWNKDWATVESEMKGITCADDIAEGHD